MPPPEKVRANQQRILFQAEWKDWIALLHDQAEDSHHVLNLFNGKKYERILCRKRARARAKLPDQLND